ncbi:MAG: leucine--tRNA ligase, partial [Phycisphaerales bacterium]|nr:leucine--tRNA ligase [Phycisphaerales bacterium]
VFTTRPDTIFGATYMVVAPEHPLVELAMDSPSKDTGEGKLRAYVDSTRNRSDIERMENKEKTGVFTGIFVNNPATGEPVPVWTADYVLMNYGTGAIMAVPAQDQRDWDFARAFDLPIVRTVMPPEDFKGEAYTGEGVATNSRFLDGLEIEPAKQKMIEWLAEHQFGASKVNYKLRDWLFSRQRYWGEPFPIVFDERGDHHAVGMDTLPVSLPALADYEPVVSDEPKPLLAKAVEWVNTTAGEAGVADMDADAKVRRETNTMPGWAGSCWYYLRYCDPKNADRLIGKEAESYWMGDNGVDLYIGGNEHAVLHLLYARFWHMAMFDLDIVHTKEPFGKLFHQGMITSFAYQRPDKSLVPIDQVENRGTEEDPEFVETATGEGVKNITAKMSKSLKNVVNPDDVIAEYGADTFRMYEMYMGPLEATKPWNTRDIIGLYRLMQKIWRLCINEETGEIRFADAPDDTVEKLLHRTIAKVGDDIERLGFNTAIAAVFEFVNGAKSLTKDQMDRFVRTIAPIVPHAAEEIYSRLGHTDSITHAEWPSFDDAMLIDDQIEIPVQIMGKLRSKIYASPNANPKELEEAALADERIKELIEGKTVRKIVVVPGRLVNIVAN